MHGEFILSREGVAATQKVALIDGRGCGVFQIPLEFGTGNYSIVSYTKCDGGDAVTEFDGKIISVFNTVTAKRVKDGVTVGEVVPGSGHLEQRGEVSVKVGEVKDGKARVRIENRSRKLMRLNIAVCHADKLEELSGSYNRTSLLERKGDFEKVDANFEELTNE